MAKIAREFSGGPEDGQMIAMNEETVGVTVPILSAVTGLPFKPPLWAQYRLRRSDGTMVFVRQGGFELVGQPVPELPR